MSACLLMLVLVRMLVCVRVRVRERVRERVASANVQCDGSATGGRGKLWLGALYLGRRVWQPREVMLDVGEDGFQV